MNKEHKNVSVDPEEWRAEKELFLWQEMMDHWGQELGRHPLGRMNESPGKCEGEFNNGKSQDVVSIWG